MAIMYKGRRYVWSGRATRVIKNMVLVITALIMTSAMMLFVLELAVNIASHK